LPDRLFLIAAASLWSLSGVFTKILSLPGPLVAFYRTLSAAVFLFLFLRKGPTFSFHRRHLVLILFFAAMNVTFISAMTVTTSANAIFLQYTAPVWMTIFSVVILKERLDRPSLLSLVIGMIGIVILLAGEWKTEGLGVGLGLLSGVLFAGVALCLRWLRGDDPRFLTFVEMAGSSIILLPFVLLTFPISQIVIAPHQMGIPYLLFARGLSTVSAQEAGVILLLEPLLNPLWTFLAVREVPSSATLVGGTFLLGSVLCRYLFQIAAPKLSRH
jgi:drug/metabolite transporter, DME family